ncbi:MAG: carboxypeptidase-like regulatory domain-containing protein [Planctomycetota bacterium]|nr:carboxypeptidase-like regulatory domain-containing protein [Planctomycetota bacterium]
MGTRSSPSKPRTLQVLLVLCIAAVVAGIVWFGSDRAEPVPAASPAALVPEIADAPSAVLAAPADAARTSTQPLESARDSAELQGPPAPAGIPAPPGRLHGRVLPAPGRTEFVGEMAVGATDALGNSLRSFCGADGSYAFEGLAAGRYWLRARSPENGDANTVVDVSGDTEHDIQLSAPRVIEVRVVDELGKPGSELGLLAVATADAPGDWIDDVRGGLQNPFGLGRFDRGQRLVAESPTEVLGRLFLERDPPLHVSLLRYQRVLETRRIEPGTEVVEFVLRTDDPRVVDGALRLRAVDAATHEPIQKVSVTLDGPGARMRSGRAGVCEFPGLMPGTYRLQLMSKDRATLRREVRVPPGETVDLGDVALDAGYWVSGRILDETGQGVSFNIRFDPCEADGRTAPIFSTVYAYPTKADGSFRVTGLAPGFHRLEVMTDGELAECVAVFDVRNGPVENASLTVTAGVPFAVDPDGKHGPGARFAVLDEKGVRVVSRIVDQPDPIRVRLAPGRYTVEFKSSREDPEPRTTAFEIVRDPVVVRMR